MRLAAFLFIAAVFAWPAMLSADWINLESGGHIEGTIVRETEREVTIRIKDGSILSVQRRQIAEYFRAEDSRKKSEHEKEAAAKEKEAEQDKGVVYNEPTAPAEKWVQRKIGDATLRLPSTLKKCKNPSGDSGTFQSFTDDNEQITVSCDGSRTDGQLTPEEHAALLRRVFSDWLEMELTHCQVAGFPAIRMTGKRRIADGEPTPVWMCSIVTKTDTYMVSMDAPKTETRRAEKLFKEITESFRLATESPPQNNAKKKDQQNGKTEDPDASPR